jgi:hypothetical protein
VAGRVGALALADESGALGAIRQDQEESRGDLQKPSTLIARLAPSLFSLCKALHPFSGLQAW